MNFFKRKHIIRRYGKPVFERGYMSSPFNDKVVMADVQTVKNESVTETHGSKSVQELKVFCDEELFTTREEENLKADRIWFQGKWFECRASRLSDNTLLAHWTCTFIECPTQEAAPKGGT